MILVAAAWAHDLQPGVLALREIAPQVYEVRITPAQDGGASVPLVPMWPSGCARDGRNLRCDAPLTTVRLPGLAHRRVKVVVHAALSSGTRTFVLAEGEDEARLRAPPLAMVVAGAEHVLGLDHVGFVLGLAMVTGAGLRRLLGAVTAFTVAHSLTLALAVLGGVVAPAAATELVIAVSVLLLAREAWLGDLGSLTTRYPWIVAFLFGLVHGLGLAGALGAIPLDGRAGALVGFNVGVELGQLGVLGVGLLAATLAARAGLPGEVGRRLGAAAIGVPAGVWTVARAWAWWAG